MSSGEDCANDSVGAQAHAAAMRDQRICDIHRTVSGCCVFRPCVAEAIPSSGSGFQQIDERLVDAQRLFGNPVQDVKKVLLTEHGVLTRRETPPAQLIELLRAQSDERLDS